MICFNEDSARHLVDALRDQVQHFLHCGTIWVHGPSVEVPTTETQPRKPFGEYGILKAQIEAYLLDEAHRNGFLLQYFIRVTFAAKAGRPSIRQGT